MREEVLQTVTEADRVLAGTQAEVLAIRKMETGKALVVIYRETSPEDGFVITAFLTSRWESLDRRQQVWPPKK